MKVTKKNIEKFRNEFAAKLVKALEDEFGPLEDFKKQFTESEWRVLDNSYRFEGVLEIVEHAQITMEMLKDKWEDLAALDEYMASGDWQKDYEAEERGELRKNLPKGVLSQDQLYNALKDMDGIMKDMRRLCRHYKTGNRSR